MTTACTDTHCRIATSTAWHLFLLFLTKHGFGVLSLRWFHKEECRTVLSKHLHDASGIFAPDSRAILND